MKTLTECCQQHYIYNNYNCSEAILHGANDYFDLNLHDQDMIMLSGFGSGMYLGMTCGALVGANAVLSLLIVKERAHEHLDQLRPAAALLLRNFKAKLGQSDCAKIKPVYWNPEEKCLHTVTLASEALDDTISELKEKGLLKPEYCTLPETDASLF